MSSPSQQPSGSGAATLGRLFERLGATLLSLEAGHLDPQTRVDSVILHDPLDPSVITSGTVVLGVGISGPAEMASQIRALASEGAVALVVREPVPMTPEIGEAVADTGIVLLGLIRGASWIQVATMLTTALAPDGIESGLAGTGSDAAAELFELADAIAALLEAPVTIENLSSRVLAFSANQAGTDEPRRQTILGLQVPEIYGDVQRAQGVFRQVYAAPRPVFVNSIEPGTLPRAAMRVKAGEEVLGSIWAVVREPLTEQRAQGMVEASRVVALTMLRARMASDSSVKLRQSLVSMLLEGGLRAREAASQLNISAASACVLALAPESSTDVNEARSESELQRVTSALNMYLQPISPRAVAALLGGIIYAVVPFAATGEDSQSRALQLASEFVGRMKTQGRFSVGVGSIVSNVSELAQSRSDADGALRVLRSRSTDGARVATVDSVQVEWLMLRISDSLAADGVVASGPISVLRSYDVAHGTEFVATLRTWLDNLGDVRAAASSLHVHVNTFRYRLRRLKEIAQIDLANPDTRFGLMLQLRLLP
jgi:DNA-binding PucR family transcriptional regulator